MSLKKLFKYGLPLSFVYCTVYQQEIWREGDDRLIEEQKRTWRNFFNLLDHSYSTVASKLNLSQEAASLKQGPSLLNKYDSLDMVSCWNSKVYGAFSSMDEIVSNPKMIICKLGRMVQPYLNSPPKLPEGHPKTETSDPQDNKK